MVYITFLSMETRDIVLSHIFRSDGAIPPRLRKHYGQRFNQKSSNTDNVKSLSVNPTKKSDNKG